MYLYYGNSVVLLAAENSEQSQARYKRKLSKPCVRYREMSSRPNGDDDDDDDDSHKHLQTSYVLYISLLCPYKNRCT